MSDETMQVARQHRAWTAASALDEHPESATPRHLPEHPSASTTQHSSSS